MADGATWFFQQVNYGNNQWTFHSEDPTNAERFTQFGNFNFGAAGRAVCFSVDELLFGAGVAQAIHDLGMLDPLQQGDYFDDPRDKPNILDGAKYYDNQCYR